MAEEEVWVPINDFPDYLVSTLGGVRHVDRPLQRKAAPNHRGFPTLALFRKPSQSRYVRQLNKLVAEAFCSAPEYDDQTSVWHIDGDILNCRADNLKWESRDRILEWNEMHRLQEPKYKTPAVMLNRTGRVFPNAFELAIHEGVLESAVIAHAERYTDAYADRAKYQYV